jgi:hypothetical protein
MGEGINFMNASRKLIAINFLRILLQFDWVVVAGRLENWKRARPKLSSFLS